MGPVRPLGGGSNPVQNSGGVGATAVSVPGALSSSWRNYVEKNGVGLIFEEQPTDRFEHLETRSLPRPGAWKVWEARMSAGDLVSTVELSGGLNAMSAAAAAGLNAALMPESLIQSIGIAEAVLYGIGGALIFLGFGSLTEMFRYAMIGNNPLLPSRDSLERKKMFISQLATFLIFYGVVTAMGGVAGFAEAVLLAFPACYVAGIISNLSFRHIDRSVTAEAHDLLEALNKGERSLLKLSSLTELALSKPTVLPHYVAHVLDKDPYSVRDLAATLPESVLIFLEILPTLDEVLTFLDGVPELIERKKIEVTTEAIIDDIIDNGTSGDWQTRAEETLGDLEYARFILLEVLKKNILAHRGDIQSLRSAVADWYARQEIALDFLKEDGAENTAYLADYAGQVRLLGELLTRLAEVLSREKELARAGKELMEDPALKPNFTLG